MTYSDDLKHPGPINDDQTKELLDNQILENINTDEIDESAFDLHLSNKYWKMEGSVKPMNDENINNIIGHCINGGVNTLDGELIIEKGDTYLFEIKERVDFTDEKLSLFGQATGKSTIGRLDVLTRLIALEQDIYDNIKFGYHKSLYIEITPITFDIVVREDTSLNQLRVFIGKPDISELSYDEIPYYIRGGILDTNYQPIIEPKNLRKLSVDLKPMEIRNKNVIAFRAKEDGGLTPIDISNKENENKYDPGEYWDLVEADEKNGENFVAIEPEKFYILRSKERFALPEDIAVYCRAVTEELGEIRIHYAGFVHPKFGSTNKEEGETIGSPLIFEVRGHNVRTILRDGETLANLNFYKMSRPYTGEVKTKYAKQELQLSKYFKKWE